MNPLSYEVELYGLALLLYLYDSSVLLYANQAILTRTGPDRWSASWGLPGFLLAGRTLSVLNAVTPHRPAFRLSWDFSHDDVQGVDARWSEAAQGLQALAPCVSVAGVALFLILPLGLFTALGAYAVAAAVGLLYGSLAWALLRLHGERELLAAGGRSFWGFGFECIACPPFGVNMLRRFSLALKVSEPLPVAAARLLDAGQWDQVREQCIARINVAMQSAEEGSREYLALCAHKAWLYAYAGRP